MSGIDATIATAPATPLAMALRRRSSVLDRIRAIARLLLGDQVHDRRLEAGLVAGPLDGRDQFLGRTRDASKRTDAWCASRLTLASATPGTRVERTLHPDLAGGAGHPLDRDLHARQRVGRQDQPAQGSWLRPHAPTRA